MPAFPPRSNVGWLSEIAGIVSAYGVIAPEVIDPALFEAMIRDLLHAHQAADRARLERVRAECQRIIDLFPDDEPDGNGFYAFAAVVAVHYAADAVLEDPCDGVVNAVRRLQDVLGFADDEGCGGAYQQAVEWLRHLDEAGERELRATVESDARRRLANT